VEGIIVTDQTEITDIAGVSPQLTTRVHKTGKTKTAPSSARLIEGQRTIGWREADRPSALAVGEQPGRGVVVADGGVAAAGGDELPDKGGEGLGQDDRFASEAQPDVRVVEVNAVEGEAADVGWPLGVEQDEQAGDAVFESEGVVAEQSAGVFPAGLGVDDAR
jgi:hypothetical protein